MKSSCGAGIYIHVPFCIKKCRYCDFYSIEKQRFKEYTDVLTKSIKSFEHKQKAVDTIYFGGGTPSVLPLRYLDTILNTVVSEFHIKDDCEVSLEVNPGTADADYFMDLAGIGVNRLNIGIQSFQDDNLRLLGRIHSGEKAIKTFYTAREKGFKNIGLDVIFALPSQTRDSLLEDLERAVSLAPEHISAYMLTLEKGTPFFAMADNKEIEMPDEDTQADFFETVVKFLGENGYIHYEVSNYAKGSNNISQHNSKYWSGSSYYGFGPSAHSFEGNLRWSEPADFDIWSANIKNNGKRGQILEYIDSEKREMEFIYLGLRTKKGIDKEEYLKLFGRSFEEKYQNLITLFKKNKMMKSEKENLYLTTKGFLLLDYITSKFIEESD